MNRILCWAALLVALAGTSCPAQPITAFACRYSDSFKEWTIAIQGDAFAGDLRRRWQTREDWTAWDYRIGEHSGQIRLKWPDNPNEWEIIGDNETIIARTMWNGDFRQWRLSNGRQTITIQTRYSNLSEEWEKKEDKLGYFGMYTAYQGDPREWIVVDELAPEVTLPMRIALAFIVLFHSTPKQ